MPMNSNGKPGFMTRRFGFPLWPFRPSDGGDTRGYGIRIQAAFSNRTAHTLSSGILAIGSYAVLVSILAAASAK